MSNVIDISGGNSSKPSARPSTSAMPTQVNIDLNSAPELHCPKCNSIFFQELTFFKKLSALTSPTGKEAIIPVTAYACVECGTINPELLPTGFAGFGGNDGKNSV